MELAVFYLAIAVLLFSAVLFTLLRAMFKMKLILNRLAQILDKEYYQEKGGK